MSDRRRQYTPSPIPATVDAAWLRQEFSRLGQSLALIYETLGDIDVTVSVDDIIARLDGIDEALTDIDETLGGIDESLGLLDSQISASHALHFVPEFAGPPAIPLDKLSGWDDLRFPAQAINPAGAADAPQVDSTLADFPGTLLFSGTLENVICGVAQMPHAWKRGSAIKPHIHWAKPTGSSSAVAWVMYYRHLGMAGEAPGAWVGPVSGTIVAGDQTVSNQHVISSFGEIDMVGKKESSCINWQIRRLGNTDADNNAIRLLEFDIHYEVGKQGTIPEIPT